MKVKDSTLVQLQPSLQNDNKPATACCKLDGNKLTPNNVRSGENGDGMADYNLSWGQLKLIRYLRDS